MKDQETIQKFSSNVLQEENQLDQSGISLAAPNYGDVSQMSAASSLPAVIPSPIVNTPTVQKKTSEGDEEVSSESEIVQAKLATNAPPPYNNNGKPAPVQMKKGTNSTGSEKAMAESLAKKSSNANYITDELFFARHKDMPRRKLKKRSSDPDEQALVKEWLGIKSGIVIPAIQKVRNGGGEEETPEKEKPGKEKPKTGKPGGDDKAKEDPKDGGGKGEPENKNPEQGGGGTDTGTGGGKEEDKKEDKKDDKTGGGGGGTGGTDWESIGLNITRTILEIGRFTGPAMIGPVPLGPACGVAANSINFYQDFVAASNLDDNGLIVLTGIRNSANILAGLAGDLSYCSTVVQNILLGSVVGAELAPVTVLINETLDIASALLNCVKVSADSATMTYSYMRGCDIEASDPAKAAEYQKVANGYLANTIADNISLFFDLVDIFSGGVFQGEVGDKIVGVAKGTGKFGESMKQIVVAMAKSRGLNKMIEKSDIVKMLALKFSDIVIGVWGGDIIGLGTGDDAPAEKAAENVGKDSADGVKSLKKKDGETPAQMTMADTVRDISGEIMLNELKTVEYFYNLGSDSINKLPEFISEILASAEEHAKELTGSKDPFKDILNLATDEIKKMEGQLTNLSQSKVAIGELNKGLLTSYEYIDYLEGLLTKLEIPAIDLFEDKEIGDNPIADVLEGVVNAGQDVAEDALQIVLDQVQKQIDKIKEIVKSVLAKVKEELDFCYRWMEMLNETIDKQILFVRDLIASVRIKLESCKNFEDVFNAMLAAVSDVLGLEEDITIDSIVEKWNEFDAVIKGGINLAQAWVNENVKANPNPAQKSEKDSSSPASSSSSVNQDLDPGFQSSVEKHTKTPVSDFSISKNDKRADNIGAKAYNQGNNLVFGQGQFNPSTKSGKFLIAHEMAHSMQNSNLKATGTQNGMSINDDPGLESEADSVAKKIVDDSDK